MDGVAEKAALSEGAIRANSLVGVTPPKTEPCNLKAISDTQVVDTISDGRIVNSG